MNSSEHPVNVAQTSMDPKVQAALQQHFTRIDNISEVRDSVLFSEPGEYSKAASGLKDPLLRHAFHHAGIGLAASIDHLDAWRRVFRAGDIPTYAPYSLIRTAHETALLSYWLMDPNINEDTRRERAVAAQMADYRERHNFEVAAESTAPEPPNEARLAKDRIGDLLKAAIAAGLTKQNGKGDHVLAVQVPKTMNLFDLYESTSGVMKGELLYRLYSGYAHGKPWALTIGAQQRTEFDGSGNAIAQTEADDVQVLVATIKAIDATERATKAYEYLYR